MKSGDLGVGTPLRSEAAYRQITLTLVIIISAKWTKWMAETMCSFDVRVCLSSVYLGAADRWELNANISKTVKATDFKVDTRVPRDSSDLTPKKLCQKGAYLTIYLAEICTLTSAF